LELPKKDIFKKKGFITKPHANYTGEKMPETLDMLKRNLRKVKDGLELKLDGVETKKLLKTLNHFAWYMEDRDGFHKKPFEIGPKSNPSEIDHIYMYKGIEITIHAERSRYDDFKHNLKMTFISETKCAKSVANEICMHCLRKSLK